MVVKAPFDAKAHEGENMSYRHVTADWLKHAKTSAETTGGLVVCHVKVPICSSPPRQDSPDHGPCNAKGPMLMGTPL